MILDTCAFLWLAHDQGKFSAETLKQIDAEPVVYISPITGFEIGIKYKTGKLHLPVPPENWIPEILDHHQIGIADLNIDICVKATQLPFIHRDPCDRFIIATALILGLPVVTADRRFAEYGVEVMI